MGHVAAPRASSSAEEEEALVVCVLKMCEQYARASVFRRVVRSTTNR